MTVKQNRLLWGILCLGLYKGLLMTFIWFGMLPIRVHSSQWQSVERDVKDLRMKVSDLRDMVSELKQRRRSSELANAMKGLQEAIVSERAARASRR